MIKSINCPYCNAEYLPGEIYLPKHLVGQPRNILRDEKNAVLFSEGVTADDTETYCCDFCNRAFKVTANISFICEKDAEADFDSEYSTKIK